jgi:hypothetical protein
MPRRNATGANRRYIFRPCGLPTDELDRLSIADGADDAAHAAGNADEIKRGAVRERVRRHEAQPAIAWHRSVRFGDNMRRRMRQPSENLQWTGKVELRQIGKNDKAEIEI